MTLLKKGDEAAFTEIYNRYWQPLFRTVYRILGEEETARDIVQNIFIRLWQKKEEVRITHLNAYLHQAGRYSVYKAIRQKKHDQSFYERLAYITVDIIQEDPLLFKEQKELLQQLIDALPENCRETFRLSREENLTYKQIAAQLSISEKTVEKRISKSLQVLRSGLSVTICISVLEIIALK